MRKQTKDMYDRNINILDKYEDFDFNKWQPENITFERKNQTNSIVKVTGLELKVMPHHVFSFVKDDVKQIGAIWFVAKLKGFRNDEVGMFTDALFSYLKRYHAKDYKPSSEYCLAVDVSNGIAITQRQLEAGEINRMLESTVAELKRIIQ